MVSTGRGDGVEAGGAVIAAAPVLGRGVVWGGVTFEGDWISGDPRELGGTLHKDKR